MILVLNTGSSSIKYMFGDRRGEIERIGQPGAAAGSHHEALEQILAQLRLDPAGVRAVGHRVVHGGERFSRPTVVTDEVLAEIRRLVTLAPLHNPPAIEGIEAARRLLAGVTQVAVFDTAFHAGLPPAAATYAIDADLARRYGIRRYGFHGISVEYVVRRTATLLEKPLTELNIIVLHLGNGASATAVHRGRSVETSMGFTPLEGLVMGTRSGDIDPAIVTFLQREAGMSSDDVGDLLVHHSGLLGLAGASDMRAVLAAHEEVEKTAALALSVYCHRIRKYVGAYHAVLGHVDAIVFTGGVGEHAAAVRELSLAGLQAWGIAVDPARNNLPGDAPRVVSSPDPLAAGGPHDGASSGSRRPDASVFVCVVPTDEEESIAEQVATLLE